MWASPTRAGPPTAFRPRATPTRTSRATASPSFTTASSKITRRCAPGSIDLGYEFSSETDTEVIAHRIHHHLAIGLESVRGRAQNRRANCTGAYALAVVSRNGPGAHRPRARGLPGRHRPGHRREFRGIGRRGAAAGDPALHVPGGRRRCRDSPQIDQHRGSHGHARRRGPCAKAICRPTRWSAASTGTSCSRRSTSSRARLRKRWRSASPARNCWMRRSGRTPRQVFRRVKAVHIAACGTSYHAGPRGQLFPRADLPHPGARRDRERVPLPRSGDHAGHAVRHHLAVRRDRRYAGGAAQRKRTDHIYRRSRSATWPKAPWCASRSSCC